MANQTVDDVLEFAAREGNKVIESEINLKARLFSALDKVPMTGKLAVVNVSTGGFSSVTQMTDFGTLPDATSNIDVQGSVGPVGYFARLGLGRMALKTLSGVNDSADLLETRLADCATDMSRQIGRAMFGSELASPASGSVTNSAGTTTIVCAISGGLGDYKQGEAYIYESALSGTSAVPVRCTNVSYLTDAVAEVTFKCGVGGVPGFDTSTLATAVAGAGITNGVVRTSDKFYLRGSRVEGSATTGLATTAAANPSLVDLQTITGTGTLHGIASGTDVGWNGVEFTSVGSPTAELFLTKSRVLAQIGGESHTHVVMSPLAASVYAQAAISNGSSPASQVVRNVDGRLDKYGKDGDAGSMFVGGKPIIEDENCPLTDAFLINKKWLKIGEWSKLQAEDEAGSPLLLSRTTFSKEIQFSALYNMICRKRNAIARLSGVTVS